MHLPLADFFDNLRRSGFLVTPKQIEEALRVVNQYAPEINNETDLISYLTPIFANNPAEQAQFHQIFRQFFVDHYQKPPPLPPPPPPPPPSYTWAFLVFSFLTLGWLIWYFGNKASPNPPLFELNLYPDNTALSSIEQKRVTAVVAVGGGGVADSLPKLNNTVLYNWGDGSPTQSLAEHWYTAEGNYTVTAQVKSTDAENNIYFDTLVSHVLICFETNHLGLSVNSISDTVLTFQPITLRVLGNDHNNQQLSWQISEGIQMLQQSNESATVEFITTGQKEIKVFATADSLNDCQQKATQQFFVKSSLDPPSVQIKPAEFAQPLKSVQGLNKMVFVVLALLCLFPIASGWYAHQKLKEIKRRRLRLSGNLGTIQHSESLTDGAASVNLLPVAQGDLNLVARAMRGRIEGNLPNLDPKKTIDKATRQMGFVDPVFSNRTIQFEFLVLIEDPFEDGLQVKLFDYLFDYLMRQQVFLQLWYYRHDIQALYNKNDHQTISLEKLSSLFPNHFLLVIGSGSQLLYPDYPSLDKKVVELIERWQNRALITPVPYLDWSNKEKSVLPALWPVYPADVEGLQLFCQTLQGQPINRELDLEEIKQNSYSCSLFDFNDPDDLADYCAEATWANQGTDPKQNLLFQWLAATAIFPLLSWQMLLQIGRVLFEKNGNLENFNYTTLLKLVRIEWIRQGQFPSFLRFELLKHLSPENEVITRETILLVLQNLESNTSDPQMRRDLEVQRLTNEFILYAFNPVQYIAYADSKIQFENLYSSGQLVDMASNHYLQNPDLGWQTLINKPGNQNGFNGSNLPLEEYMKAPSQGAKQTNRGWKTLRTLSIVAFVLFLGTLLSAYFFENSIAQKLPGYSIPKQTAQSIQFVVRDTCQLNDQVRWTLRADTITLPLRTNDTTEVKLTAAKSSYRVALFFEGNKVLDTVLQQPFDAYALDVACNPVLTHSEEKDGLKPTPITVQVLMSKKCFDQFNTINQIVQQVDSTAIMIPNILDAGTPNCLTAYDQGEDIDTVKVASILNGLRTAGYNLVRSAATTQPQAGELILFDNSPRLEALPEVSIQISDRALYDSANAFATLLTKAGYSVRPVSLVAFNFPNEVSYYDASLANPAVDISKRFRNFTRRTIATKLRISRASSLYNQIVVVSWRKEAGTAKPTPPNKPTGDPVKTNPVEPKASCKVGNLRLPATVESGDQLTISFTLTCNIRDLGAGVPGQICFANSSKCTAFELNTSNLGQPIVLNLSTVGLDPGRRNLYIAVKDIDLEPTLGSVAIQSRPVAQTVSGCDTLNTWLYDQNNYNQEAPKNPFAQWGVEIVGQNSKGDTYQLTVRNKGCPKDIQNLNLSPGRTASVRFCNGQRLIVTMPKDAVTKNRLNRTNAVGQKIIAVFCKNTLEQSNTTY